MKHAIKKIINIISAIVLAWYGTSILFHLSQNTETERGQLITAGVSLVIYLATCADCKYRLLPLWKRFLRVLLFPVILFAASLGGIEAFQTDSVKTAVFSAAAAIVLLFFYLQLFNPIANVSRKKLATMEGHEFEEYCASVLKKNGFTNVRVTQGSSDYGADIIARKRGRRWVIQCKRYQSVVNSTPIQEITAAMRYYHAKRAAVITNSTFTANAVRLAKVNGVLLIDGDELARMSKR